MQPKVLYLAGPMSGLPAHNYPAFFQAEDRLRLAGYLVANPARIEGSHETWKWSDWMRAGIATMLRCEAVAVLEDYRDSRGAMIETELARDLGMPIEYVDTWLQVAEAA